METLQELAWPSGRPLARSELLTVFGVLAAAQVAAGAVLAAWRAHPKPAYIAL